jgi:hypothetical protein
MRPILWQQIKADIYTRENLVSDSIKNKDLYFENEKIQMQIFKNYGITKEEFYESYKYYLAHEDKLGIIIDTMIAQQTRINFEEMTNQANSNRPKPTNIFIQELLKKKPIFSMSPDTLPKEIIITNPSFNNLER